MLSNSEFESLVLNGQGKSAVEFMSYGCAHCRVMEPVVKQVAVLLAGRETLFQVNLAAEEGLAEAFNVDGTPTFIMFLDGQEVGRATGPSPTVTGLLAALTQPFE